MTDLERLLARVEYDPFGGCWLWALSCTAAGYGQIVVAGVHHYAHRYSWEAHNGPIPDGSMVLHRCDVPACVNPAHLFLGDAMANTHDMMAKGRDRPPPPLAGEANFSAKLTEAQVLEIRARYVPRKVSTTRLAAEFDVSQSLVSDIVNRKVWAHI